jgi:hypothetical protein
MAVRAAGLRFGPGVPAGDQQWILAAIENARPEARSLIDDVDGMVVVTTFSEPGGRAVGMMRPTGPDAYEVSFNVAYLDADRKIDRDSTVIHELGHVVDAALVPPELRNRLAAALPSVGAGYGVATPASLEDWGAPLAELSIRIDVAAGR